MPAQPAPAALRLTAVAGVAAALAFPIGVLLAARAYPKYQHLTQAISELGATNAPAPILQAVNFVFTGLLTLVFATGLVLDRDRRRGGVLFGVLGAVMVAHGMLPCDAACQPVTTVGTAHNVIGLVGFIMTIAGVWWLAREAPPGWYRTFSHLSAATGTVGFALWIALAQAAKITVLIGSLQRVFVTALLGWMLVTALRDLWKHRARRGHPAARSVATA